MGDILRYESQHKASQSVYRSRKKLTNGKGLAVGLGDIIGDNDGTTCAGKSSKHKMTFDQFVYLPKIMHTV